MKSIFLTPRFFSILTCIATVSVFGYFIPILYSVAIYATLLFSVATIIDFFLLYNIKKGVEASRITPKRLSNGDDNSIEITLKQHYNFTIIAIVIDELPPQFQIRDFLKKIVLASNENHSFNYSVRPTARGIYNFGNINIAVTSPLQLIKRRYKIAQNKDIACYPSFIQMRKYELLAISNRLTDLGVKRIRKIGHQMEFDQIRDYVKGDDYRTINWKATARRSNIMVNQYQDEKSQPIYSVIDCGRTMKMPFNGLSLLDYAINTSLVIANTAILKQDKAGLICFDKTINSHLIATSQRTQIQKIIELLYKQETSFPEPNFELLYTSIKYKIRHRSLFMLYTNFESIDSMRRQLPYLQAIAKSHLLVVIFFSNTEILSLRNTSAKNVEDIYTKTIGEKFIQDKQHIVKELKKYGIHSIYTKPENLTINTLNKYLELKDRGLI